MNLFLAISVLLAVNVCAVPTPKQNTFDLEAFDISAILPKRDTEEKLKCIQDGIQKLFIENTDLYWWFDEGGKTGLKLIEDYEKCDLLSGLAQARCLLKFRTTSALELRKLQKQLPDDKKDIPTQLKEAVKACLAESIIE